MHEYWTQCKYVCVALSMGLQVEMGKSRIELGLHLLLYTHFCCILFDENNTSRVVLRAHFFSPSKYVH